MTLPADLRALAEAIDFSGVVVVARGGDRLAEVIRGAADRANGRPNTLDTRFGMASVTKGMTALTAVALIESGALRFDTTLRSLLGDDLPLVDPGVTIEHVLGHTSGVGDYLDEDQMDDVDAYLMPIPVHLVDRRRPISRSSTDSRNDPPPARHSPTTTGRT